MYVTPEQIAATNKAGVEAILGFANSQFAAFERLSALSFNATKSAFEESVDHAKSLLGAKDIQEFVRPSLTRTWSDYSTRSPRTRRPDPMSPSPP